MRFSSWSLWNAEEYECGNDAGRKGNTAMDKQRVLEWTSSTNQDRKTLYFIVQAICSARNLKLGDVYEAAYGRPMNEGELDRSNFSSGSIGHKLVAPIFKWVAENHLAFASEHAPEIFDPSLLTRLSSIVAEHAIYDQLNPIPLNSRGLTKRSSRQPIHDLRLKLGDQYCFELESKINGSILSLEGYKGEFYPFSLHSNGSSFLTPYEAGKHLLPRDAETNDPIALSDNDHAGVHSFIFFVAPTILLKPHTQYLFEEKAMTAKQLDELALAFKNIDLDIFEIHRLNVIFTP